MLWTVLSWLVYWRGWSALMLPLMLPCAEHVVKGLKQAVLLSCIYALIVAHDPCSSDSSNVMRVDAPGRCEGKPAENQDTPDISQERGIHRPQDLR